MGRAPSFSSGRYGVQETDTEMWAESTGIGRVPGGDGPGGQVP